MKASAAITGYEKLIGGLPLYPYALINDFSVMSAVVSNIFLFQFGISILTYKIKTIIDYKIFPILLFVGYMMLYVSGIIEPSELDTTSRFSFGYNGAILGCVGCINLYYDKRKEYKRDGVIYGLLLLGVGLLVYAITEGILTSNILPWSTINILKVSSAILLVISSLTVTDLMEEEKVRKIGFI